MPVHYVHPLTNGTPFRIVMEHGSGWSAYHRAKALATIVALKE
jgi:hypothetical protein